VSSADDLGTTFMMLVSSSPRWGDRHAGPQYLGMLALIGDGAADTDRSVASRTDWGSAIRAS